MPDTIYLEWGRIEFSKNEVSLISTVEDPPKVRLAAAAGLSLGAATFNRLRPDGVQEELILIQGKQDERTRGDPTNLAGEITIHINDGRGLGDASMVKVMEIRHDSVWIKGING
mgnify:CR=1 FL=1